jgi:hypothetical protein
MNEKSDLRLLSIGIIIGLAILGYALNAAVNNFKGYERTVTVKGLAEQEHMADIVIWPIQYTVADNDLEQVYKKLSESREKVKAFLMDKGIEESELSFSTPFLFDKKAQQYGGAQPTDFRYVSNQTITVYSEKVAETREVMGKLDELGKSGVALTGDQYQLRTQYLFNRLNDIKPEMIEQSTIEARKVAQKFAEDSDSRLGKIKTAYQGQFSISDRDANNPHIKKVRVVSTVVYYLSD